MKNIYLIVAILGVSGCVSIEAPENLVSDTVEAGKNAYVSIKSKMSKDNQGGEIHVFSYEHIVQEGEVLSDSNSKCIDGAIEQARKTLNVYNVEVVKTTSKTSEVEDQQVLECSIFVSKQ